jgi:hypothetical protein
MWASGAGSSAASGKFCDGTNASAKLRGKPRRLTTGLPHFAHAPRLIAGGARWRRNSVARLSGSVTDSAQKNVTSANGLPYAFRQIAQWQKKRPTGSPRTAKREAPQRQAQSWFTMPFRLDRDRIVAGGAWVDEEVA